jgi:hypothetical protein
MFSKDVSNFTDVIVGFLRVILTAICSTLLAVVFLFKKVLKALCGMFVSSRSKVGLATAAQMELAQEHGLTRVERVRKHRMMSIELEQLADDLANPSLYMHKE